MARIGYNFYMNKNLAIISAIIIFASVAFSSPQFSVAKEYLEKIEKDYGRFAPKRVLALVKTMNSVRDGSDMDKLKAVNDFFNRVPYANDQDIWGVSDYWATRYEFIGKDKGDCEDYVIAKYFTLKELGVDTSKLFMSYVKSTRYNASHLVLTYYETPKSIPMVLDNYNFKILPATERDDLVPIYSFSGDDLFNAKQAQVGKLLPASTKQNKSWTEMSITR